MRPEATATILATLALAVAACAGRETRSGSAPAAVPPRAVRTVEVVRTREQGAVMAPATVQARERAVLSARITASVVQLQYREGQRVKAGTVVVRLEDAALRATVAAARARVTAAEADLARTRTLVAQGAATRRDLEQVTAAASGARAQLTAALDGLSYTELRAPFAGRVAARRVNLGDVVSAGTPLIEIEGEGGLELRATVESELAAALRPGSRLEAQVDGRPQPLLAVVTALAPAGDPTTHRFELKADLPADGGLRAGLFARLLVPGVAGDPRLVVPAGALFERGGLSGVYVVSGGRARLRWVAAGTRDGDTAEVRGGVEADERVVLEPAGLADGDPVREAR